MRPLVLVPNAHHTYTIYCFIHKTVTSRNTYYGHPITPPSTIFCTESILVIWPELYEWSQEHPCTFVSASFSHPENKSPFWSMLGRNMAGALQKIARMSLHPSPLPSTIYTTSANTEVLNGAALYSHMKNTEGTPGKSPFRSTLGRCSPLGVPSLLRIQRILVRVHVCRLA